MWPFSRKEEDRSTGYTDLVQQGYGLTEYPAEDMDKTAPLAMAAIEIAAGHWSRAFAMAEITPKTMLTQSVTPVMMSMMGRDLVRFGESLYWMDTRGGMMDMAPVSHYTLWGDPRRSSWRYRVTLAGPSKTEHRVVPYDGLVHVRYGWERTQPYYGRAPWRFSDISTKMATYIETRLREETSAQVGHVLPVPNDPSDQVATDDGPKSRFQSFKENMQRLRGKTIITESVRTMADSRSQAPQSDWKTTRIGANPPATLTTLRSDIGRDILAACGVPPSLAAESSDGTAQRESWRRFLHSTIAPMGELIAYELSEKLEVDVNLSFEKLFASDLSGRARAFQSMVGGGMDATKAAALAGLMEGD